VVTLTSDFGFDDPYVGIMKGVLLSQQRGLALVDLTHSVPPQDVRAAAFVLERSWRWFPPGSVHVAVVDPGVGSERAILAGFDRGHAFLAPDNGLLSGVLSASADVRALALERFSLPRRSRTFHGRDVFAPAAAALAAGEELKGPPVDPASLRRPELPAPRAGPGWLEALVVGADRFGNVELLAGEEDLRRAGLAPGERVVAVVAGAGRRHEATVGRAFADVPHGGLLVHVDSSGAVALAVNGGDAADLLQTGPGLMLALARGA
jgi:S-adenosylmethionine hydrolase